MALLKKSKNALAGNFIEGMACTGGCIQGPANLIRSPKNKQELEEHKKSAQKTTVLDAPAGEKKPAKKEKAASKTEGGEKLV